MSLNENEFPIGIVQWIYWLGATVTACIAIMIFLYNTFQTKIEANENKVDLEHRLGRMEDKLDQLLLMSRKRPEQ